MVGVGRMGSLVVRHLRASGFAVQVFDPALDEQRHTSLASLLREVTTIVTVLPGHAEFAETASATLAGLTPGSVWVDMTTGDPRTTARVAVAAEAADVVFVSALITGSVDDFASGRATLLTSGGGLGADAVIDAVAGGSAVVSVGDGPADAQTVKLLGNALWFATAAATTEVLLLGQSLGIAPDRLRALLRDGPGGNVFLDHHAGLLLDGDDVPDFGIGRVVEELATGVALARSGSVATPQLDASADTHAAALAHYGPAPGELLGLRWLELRAGATLRR